MRMNVTQNSDLLLPPVILIPRVTNELVISMPKNEDPDLKTKTKARTSIFMFVPKTPAESPEHLGDRIISITERNYNASVENQTGQTFHTLPARNKRP